MELYWSFVTIADVVIAVPFVLLIRRAGIGIGIGIGYWVLGISPWGSMWERIDRCTCNRRAGGYHRTSLIVFIIDCDGL